MTFILTLVASQAPLTAAHIAQVTQYIESNKIGLRGVPDWRARAKAVDLTILSNPSHENIEALWKILEKDRIDLFVTDTQKRRKKLLLADMDSTIITDETLDEIAIQIGIGDKVTAITERAMRGELDFSAALRARVQMLSGHDAALLHNIAKEITLSPGASSMISAMRKNGTTCVLVSGGFTFFTEKIAQKTGFHHHHGNILEITDSKITGAVADPILDKDTKLALLQKYTQQLNIDLKETMAIGDGANDLPMLQAAGLGIGYHPKPLLRQTLNNCILYGDLSAALYAQGYHEEDIIHDRAAI